MCDATQRGAANAIGRKTGAVPFDGGQEADITGRGCLPVIICISFVFSRRARAFR